MAIFVLINTVVVGGTKVFAGDNVNDAVDDANSIRNAGGLLWPASDPTIAAASLKAQNARVNRGANEAELDSIMKQAVDAVQLVQEGSDAWRNQGAWFIDSTVGNDNNSGASGSPIKTLAELGRRFGRGALLPGVDSSVIAPIKLIAVNLTGNFPDTDPLDIEVTLPANCLLAFVGTPTSVRTGTLTAVTTKTPGTNTPWAISDAGSPFSAADIVSGRRVRITSGANAGQFAWAAKDLGAGSLRMSSFSTPTMPGAPDVLIQTGLTTGIVAISDPYVVEDLQQIRVRRIRVDSAFGGTSTSSIVGFANLYFVNVGGAAGLSPMLQGTITGIFKGCAWDGQHVPSNHIARHQYLNCQFRNLAFNTAVIVLRGGLIRGAVLHRGVNCTPDDDLLIQGGPYASFSSLLTIGALAIFDSPTAGLELGSAGCPTNAIVANQLSGAHRLWGSGNATDGVDIRAGSTVSYQTTVPTITGSTPGTDDFRLGGVTNNARAFDDATGAATTIRANSWANLAAAIGAGGFGGSAHNFDRNAHLVLRG